MIKLTSVVDPIDAIKILKQQEFQIILCDFEMAGMNGLDVLAFVHKNYNKVPFIFLTGKDPSDKIFKDIDKLNTFIFKKNFDAIGLFTNVFDKIGYYLKITTNKNWITEQKHFFHRVYDKMLNGEVFGLDGHILYLTERRSGLRIVSTDFFQNNIEVAIIK